MSLFGHHHSVAPSIVSRSLDAANAVLHLPLAVWLTILPIAGGLAIAYVTHRLSLSRDRIALRREDELRQAEVQRTTLRVRADLSIRLARHRDALRAAARGDMARLAAEHDALIRRAAKADVIDVLGAQYVAFMGLLQREETALAEFAANERDDSAQRRALDDLEADFAAYAKRFALPGAEPAVETTR